MHNILVADSAEHELNHIILLLEDYQASIDEECEGIKILETSDREKALDILERERVDLLFVSTDMESIAVESHKKSLDTLMVAISYNDEIMKDWFIDLIRKPVNDEMFKLKLNIYINILKERKNRLHSYRRNVLYDIDSSDNLYFFWKHHFTNKWNINRVVNSLYIITLQQLSKGIKSKIEVVEDSREFQLFLYTEISDEVESLIKNICKKMDYKIDGNRIEFIINFEDHRQQRVEEIREHESFAFDHLDTESIELLNDYLMQSNIAEEEDTKDSELQIFDFMSETDLELFEESTSRIEILFLDYNGKSFSPKELRVIVTSLESIKSSLQNYKDTAELSERVGGLSKAVLMNMLKFQENAGTLIDDLTTLITMLGTWHNSVIYQGASSIDFMFQDIFESIDEIHKKLK